MPRILAILGTRPEAVKLAPVLRALGRERRVGASLCVTSQHGLLLRQMLADLGLRPRRDLGLSRPGQSPHEVLSRVLGALPGVLAAERPDLVLVQGDTVTALAAALAASLAGVPVAHVEAGLRTRDPANPFPEEISRVLIDHLCSVHLAPTARARANLAAEGIRGRWVFVTGNTGVDALHRGLRRIAARRGDRRPRRRVLATLHRRELFGAPMRGVLGALRRLAAGSPDVDVLFMIHPNPEVERPARRLLRHPRIRLVEPMPYARFLELLVTADLVLTDSGGLQEECSALGMPVLVLREKTERPELMEAGGGLLVGTRPSAVLREARRALADPALRRRMSAAPCPFGDGRAGERAASALVHWLGLGPRPRSWSGPRARPGPLARAPRRAGGRKGERRDRGLA